MKYISTIIHYGVEIFKTLHFVTNATVLIGEFMEMVHTVTSYNNSIKAIQEYRRFIRRAFPAVISI